MGMLLDALVVHLPVRCMQFAAGMQNSASDRLFCRIYMEADVARSVILQPCDVLDC